MTELYVDMDGTVAEWKNSAFEELLEPGYFLNLAPYHNVVDAVKLLANDKRIKVFILSAVLQENKSALSEKTHWLDRWLPEVSHENRIFCPCGISKAEAIKVASSNKVLLDDYSRNLHDWSAHGGTGIKLLNGINGTQGTWRGAKTSRYLPGVELRDNILAIIEKANQN